MTQKERELLLMIAGKCMVGYSTEDYSRGLQLIHQIEAEAKAESQPEQPSPGAPDADLLKERTR